MDEHTAIEAFLAAHGVTTEPPGAFAQVAAGGTIGGTGNTLLRRGRSQKEYTVVHAPSMTLTAVSTLPMFAHPLLVVGSHIGERSAEAFRAAGIDYIDAAGNAHIDFDGVYIDIRGRKALHAPPPPGPPNLFSARRMQVVFALTAWPSLLHQTVRDIANVAGTSVGLAQSAVRGLEAAGYVSARRLIRRAELVELWAAAYPGSLLPKLHLGSYSGDITHHALTPGMLVSGEAALPESIRAQTLTYYVDELDPRVAMRNRWRSDRHPNIEVRRKFWRAPDPAVRPHVPHREGTAPHLLVYADLLATGEPRQREVALEMWDRGDV